MSFREDVQSFKVYDDIQHENIRGNGAKILKDAMLDCTHFQ